ncbi:MAG: MFS transporter [candidate division Zixibacteria bacterium]|nr:MFS transporter [candidate division Zixibacteria bacterium]
MKVVFEETKGLTGVPMRYCPGCGHGIAHRLVAEVIEELGVRERSVGVVPVGCSVFLDEYINCDGIQGPHGRGPAIATGIKRSKPNVIVFSYQGDGDLASIGMAETIHAAARSENITIIFINNAIYGMTGGQMAPTTLVGMRSTTCPAGRSIEVNGYPFKMCELLATLPGASYLARTSLDKAANVIKTKKAIEKAFKTQIQGKGFSMVEILSPCPTDWGMTPRAAIDRLKDEMIPYFPLGVYRDWEKEEKERAKAREEDKVEA